MATQQAQPSTARRVRTSTAAGLVVGTVGLLAALAVLGEAWTVLSGRYVVTFGGLDPRRELDALANVDLADFGSWGTVYLTDLPLWMRVLAAAPLLINGTVLAVSTQQVTTVVRHVARGDAFAPPVQRAFRVLALALLGGGILQALASTVASIVLSGAIPDLLNDQGRRWEALGFTGPQWPLLLVVLGLVASALAIAFRDGARLQEEAEGVV